MCMCYVMSVFHSCERGECLLHDALCVAERVAHALIEAGYLTEAGALLSRARRLHPALSVRAAGLALLRRLGPAPADPR